MVDTDKIRQLAPHYVVMLLIVFATTAVLRSVVGTVNLILEFVVILVIVFAYPFVIRRLGYAPSVWE